MKSPRQVLTAQLTAAVAPHVISNGPVSASKAVAKTLRQLSGQLLKQQARQVKADERAARPTKKMVHKALAGELTALLHPLLGEQEKPAKSLRKAVLQLAGQVLKQRQEVRPTTKEARKAAKNVAASKSAAAPKAEVKGPGARPVARRPASRAAPKQPAGKPTLVPVATTKGTMVVATTE
ncbi:hypothetical protein LRS06_17410 [Hymenobacter sp. J193]|uniref:hypothetical protein n=1 Tax=Hymenobacter sp. J193 TaxID=2898429 RepID=UPI0021515DBD|nr:hypothetical protein [Hymenobacter sp. J193]MCR5889515.1 hypothetical protein [Hymenobacter sp. J193]